MDLRGQTVGVIEGYRYGPDFDNYQAVNRHFSEDLETAVRLFANNRYQLFICEEFLGHYILKEYGMPYYKTMPYIAETRLNYLEIVKTTRNSEEFLKIINAGLEKLYEEGIIDEIIEKYK